SARHEAARQGGPSRRETGRGPCMQGWGHETQARGNGDDDDDDDDDYFPKTAASLVPRRLAHAPNLDFSW
ncbi:MAG: hypothetical protein AAFU61_18075, partial [Pseudomonadota bacterium]